MLYVAKNTTGDIIAYSETVDYLFRYLKTFYDKIKHNDTYGEIVLERIFAKNEIDKLYMEHEDYMLVKFWGDVILTNWESTVYEEYFYNHYRNIKTTMMELTKKQMEGDYDTLDEEIITKHLKNALGPKYNFISSYESFMLTKSSQEIIDVVNNSTLDSHIYDLNKEYKRKLSDDK